MPRIPEQSSRETKPRPTLIKSNKFSMRSIVDRASDNRPSEQVRTYFQTYLAVRRSEQGERRRELGRGYQRMLCRDGHAHFAGGRDPAAARGTVQPPESPSPYLRTSGAIRSRNHAEYSW